MRLDAKSIVFGLILGCLLMVVLGAARPIDPTPRYQMALAPGYEPHVIDQRTGSVWFIKSCNPRSWQHLIFGPPEIPPLPLPSGPK